MYEEELAAAKARISELDRMVFELQKEKLDLKQKIANAAAKYSVGQRVICRGGLYEVARIGPGYSVGSARYFGRKVLKSGELGKQEFELYGDLKPSLAKPQEA